MTGTPQVVPETVETYSLECKMRSIGTLSSLFEISQRKKLELKKVYKS